MKAFGNKIFVKVFNKDNQSESGIILVSNDKKEMPRFGEIISVGDYVKTVNPGQIVSFGNYALHTPLDDYFVMTENDIFGYFI